MVGLLTKIFKKNKDNHKVKEEVSQHRKLGRQDEECQKGKCRIIRRNSEKFKKDIKGVKVADMHEDFYEIDSI